MSNQRGMTLVEVLISTGLAGIMSAFILLIARSQLLAYEQNDQVTRMQQNQRAGIAYVETLLRRSCNAIANGRVNVFVPGASASLNCLTFYDGAKASGGSFVNDQPAAKPDAVDIIYGAPPFTAVNPATANVIGSTAPSLDVASQSGFSVGDLVLFTNYNYAVVLKIAAIKAGATTPQATFTFGTVAAVTSPDVSLSNSGNNVLMKAVLRSLYVEDGSLNPLYRNMLMLDPDGTLSSGHANAQPLVDNLVDFQLAVGADDDGNGVIDANEWRGDAAGELPLPVAPWNATGSLRPRWLRLSLVHRTANGYQGATPSLPSLEDRTSYPSTTSGTPRFRVARVTVAPRGWNLLN